MGKKTDLTKEKVAQIEILLREQYSQREIATRCNVSKSSVLRVQRNLTSGTSYVSNRRGRCGARRKSTPQDDRFLVRTVRQEGLITSTQLQSRWNERGVHVTSRTIQRRLHEMGCHSVRPRKVPRLTPRMKLKRLEFARRHADWSVENWRKVSFSDEASFECQRATRQRVWQPMGSPAPVTERVKHPTKVMIWGMFSYHGTGRLHVCEGSMNSASYLQVLQTRMIPQLNEWFPQNEGIFQQDGAPCHTARVVKRYLDEANITLLEWPGNSPDLNPLENLWAIIKRRLAAKTITTKQELIVEIIRIWHNDQDIHGILHNLVDSMPRRIAKVIEAKGGHTRY